MIPQDVLLDWVKNKKRIRDRIFRIKKRLKKYNKQLGHYEMRMRAIGQYEKDNQKADQTSCQKDQTVSNQD